MDTTTTNKTATTTTTPYIRYLLTHTLHSTPLGYNMYPLLGYAAGWCEGKCCEATTLFGNSLFEHQLNFFRILLFVSRKSFGLKAQVQSGCAFRNYKLNPVGTWPSSQHTVVLKIKIKNNIGKGKVSCYHKPHSICPHSNKYP